jgi:hypothetical protein
LDPLVKDFFQNQFSKVSNIALEDDILMTNVPIVSLPLNVNVNLILDLIKQLPTEPVIRNIYPYENFPRIQGWSQQFLWSDGTVEPIMNDIYYKKSSSPIPTLEPNDIALQIQTLLSNIGISVNMCAISNLEPNGYIRPHRDINLLKYPLGYFWLPLNNPPGNELKIYPYGTVDVTLGNLYLLNQKNFVHAVINNSTETRYVLIGWIETVSDELKSCIKNSINLMYNSLIK